MNEISDITKKLQKTAIKRSMKKIRYKKYSTKYLNFYSSSNNFYQIDNWEWDVLYKEEKRCISDLIV